MGGRAINHRVRIIVAFALLYVFWGSTYLAIRIGVAEMPPILMAGLRFLVAGPVLLAFCGVTGRRVGVGPRALWQLAVIGFLLLAFGNAVLTWSELYVPSGLAALLIASVPIWFLLVERFVLPSGDRVPTAGLAGVGLGLVGMAVLVWPRLAATHALGAWELVACLGLLVSSFTWAFGSVVSRRWHVDVDPFVASGWQMTFAGLIDTAAGLALGEHRRAAWNAAGIGAIAYLIVFGSWVGYSAYIWLLRHVPTAKVATYAYVNPVIAVFLGWLVLGESIDRYIALGTAVVVPAVALVTRSSAGPDAEPGTQPGQSPQLSPEVPPLES